MRKRLTAKRLVAESRKDGIFPGDIGNPEREKVYRDLDEYANYDWQPGWDLPEDNKIEDPRDEIGFGIPKKAAIFRIAHKAAELAEALLGENAPEKAVTAQARDFMRLGHARLVAALRRVRAAEDAQLAAGEAEAPVAPVAEEAAPAEAPVEAPAVPAPAADPEAPVAEEAAPAEAPVEAPVAEEAPAAEDPAPAAEEPAPAEPVEELAAEEEDDAAPAMELEIDPPAPAGDGYFDATDELNQAAPDPELEKFFGKGGDEAAEPAPTACRTAKKGVRHLAQPRLAAADLASAGNLESLWDNLRHPHL